MEKACEYNLELELLLAGFQGAFDTIKRKQFIKALINMEIASADELTIAITRISVRTKEETQCLSIISIIHSFY